eukprot:scaffold2729_cov403-Prasinococcus_capsulatus_cf.AAC.13
MPVSAWERIVRTALDIYETSAQTKGMYLSSSLILHKVLSNIIARPSEDKFRCLRTSNPRVRPRRYTPSQSESVTL